MLVYFRLLYQFGTEDGKGREASPGRINEELTTAEILDAIR